jgi:hypothetical protein
MICQKCPIWLDQYIRNETVNDLQSEKQPKNS